MEEQEKVDIREQLIGWIDIFLEDGIVPRIVNPKAMEANYVLRSKIKDIVDECIPKGENIITGKEEYKPNVNANSFLTQSILKLIGEE